MHWRRKWQPTPVFLPGESQGRGSLVGCRLWVAQSRTRLKRCSSSSRVTNTFTFNMGSGWHQSVNHDPNGKNKRQSKYPQLPNCSKLCFDDKNFIIYDFKSTDAKAFPFENNIAMAHYTRMLLLLLLSHFSHVRLCATPEMAAHQAPPSLGFSRQKHWSGINGVKNMS